MKTKFGTAKKKEEHKPIKKILLTIGSILVLVLIAIAFVIAPALVPSQADTLPPFGSYGGEKIEYIQGTVFANSVENYSDQMEASGQPVDTFTFYSIVTQAFQDTVALLGYEEEVKQSGYIAPDSLIERTMLPAFYDTNGVYSNRIFRDTPDSTKIEIKKQAESQVNYNLYANDISGLKTSTNEIAFIADMNKNQRSFDMVSFDTAEYPDEQIVIFGNQNAELFTQYDMNIITLNTENEANEIAAQIKNNELVFSDAVSEYSINQYSDEEGKLRNSLHYQLKNIIKAEDAFEALLQLEGGAISDVIETSTGFSIFSAAGIPKAPDFTNSTTTDAVYSYMTISEIGIIQDYFTNLGKDFAAAALIDGFDTATVEFGLEKIEVPAFPINYGDNHLLNFVPSSTITQLANAQTNAHFLEAAFSLTEGELSEPIILGNQVIVLALKEEIEDESATAENLDFMYPYYISQFDNVAIQSYFMKSDKLENNLTDVFFTHFL